MSSKTIKTIFALFALLTVLSLVGIASAQVPADVNQESVNVSNNEPENTGDARNTGVLPGIEVLSVEINDQRVEAGDEVRESLDRGDFIDVEIRLQAFEDNDNVEVEASVRGDDHFQIVDVSDVFNVRNGTHYTKNLKLKLPEIMDADKYSLRVGVFTRDGAVANFNYPLRVQERRHTLELRDVTFSPEGSVEAGRALLAVARVRNLGYKEEDNIKVQVSIPDLKVSASDYIDELETDESVSSEELYLRIPADAKPGVYNVNVVVEYDEGFEQVSADYRVEVVNSNVEEEGEPAADKETTTVNVGTEMQNVEAGQGGAIFPISITNGGKSSRTYTVNVVGAESFADVEVSPSTLVTVGPGETQPMFVYVSARQDATPGPKGFSVEIKTGDETKTIPLTANVSEPQNKGSALKTGVVVGLIVLVVLVVVLFLVIAFNKMKGSEDEEEVQAGQTYY